MLSNNLLTAITKTKERRTTAECDLKKYKVGGTHMKYFSSKDLKGFDKIKLVLLILMRSR